MGLVARGCGRRGSRRGESYAERTWALSAAGRANEAYAAELVRRTDYLNQESLSQVLVTLHRGGETSGRTVEGLVNEIWGGLVVGLYQGQEVYGGLQSRASARNALILPSETRTLSEMTRALVRTDGDDPRIQLLVDALVTLGRGDSVKDIKNADLERRSEGRLDATRRRYREVSESWKSKGEYYEPVLAELRDQVVHLEHGLNEDGPQPEKVRGGARGARERALSIDGRLRVHRRRVHQRSRIELKVFRIGIGGKTPSTP